MRSRVSDQAALHSYFWLPLAPFMVQAKSKGRKRTRAKTKRNEKGNGKDKVKDKGKARTKDKGKDPGKRKDQVKSKGKDNGKGTGFNGLFQISGRGLVTIVGKKDGEDTMICHGTNMKAWQGTNYRAFINKDVEVLKVHGKTFHDFWKERK